jgi:putative NADH-flavin reductase
LVKECLDRGISVSVLVRNKEKFISEFSNIVWPEANIFVGDAASDASVVKKACQGKDIVLCGIGAVEAIARNVAEQSQITGVKKLIHVAGATNVMDVDGVTPLWKKYADSWPPAERVFIAHGKCIDAIKATGINHVVFCPALMSSREKKSSPVAVPKINRESGGFVSYEDAAHIIVDAAQKSDWDGQLITAATAE